ncbi:hypothetical protein [Massilia sp. Se16.2.3]|uniref:hypothetical protein n=1 Tax=Massilia sp. Se16.2.3 TaxID=2709303 RepID=UPI001E5DA63F|nr:hypothetical protein [Massilia sp. Se16.2.3]
MMDAMTIALLLDRPGQRGFLPLAQEDRRCAAGGSRHCRAGAAGPWLAAAGGGGATLALDPARPPVSLQGVRALQLTGDGLREAQWRDLPARPLAWTAPGSPTLRLDFPRRLPLGRMFALTLERDDKTRARLQLLDENGRLLSETRGTGTLTLAWLPPLAETLLLQARLLDEAGKLLARDRYRSRWSNRRRCGCAAVSARLRSTCVC